MGRGQGAQCRLAGTVGALPVILAAALDALTPLGIDHIEMPLSPEKLWRAIRDARLLSMISG